MAFTIVSVNLLSSNGSKTQAGREYDDVYIVEYSGGWDSEALLNTSNEDLPDLGESKDTDDGVFCDSIDVSVEQSPAPASGVAFYKVHFAARTLAGAELHPLSRPPDIEWGGSGIVEQREFDVNGDALANAAGELFEGLPDFPVRGGECVISYNVESNPSSLCTNYSNTTNSAPWYGAGSNTGAMGVIRAVKQSENYAGTVVDFWRISIPIAFRRDGWGWKTFNWGYRSVDENGDPVNIVDKNGVVATKPFILDSNGQIAADQTNPPLYPDEDGFNMLDSLDWTSLSIPNPFA